MPLNTGPDFGLTQSYAFWLLVIVSSPWHSATRPLIERVIASVDRARDGIYPAISNILYSSMWDC